MKAAIFHRPGERLTIETVSIDNPGPRELLIRTAAVGLCHSDLHYIDGLYSVNTPAILGHEAAGVVEKVGADVTGLAPGGRYDAVLSGGSMTITPSATGPWPGNTPASGEAARCSRKPRKVLAPKCSGPWMTTGAPGWRRRFRALRSSASRWTYHEGW